MIVVSNVNFLWFPTTDLFVAFITDFLADQNIMSYPRGDLAFNFEHKALTRPLPRNMNLNGILSIFAQMTDKVGPKH